MNPGFTNFLIFVIYFARDPEVALGKQDSGAVLD